LDVSVIAVQVHIPVFLLNASDDPLVPPQVHYIPRQFSGKTICATSP